MKRFLLLATLALSVTLTACTSVPSNGPAGASALPLETVYTCVYKYDARFNVQFRESDRKIYRPPGFPNLTVYHITDTKGKRWSINQYEWLDYKCSLTKTAIRNKV